jgi:hypothetical protein
MTNEVCSMSFRTCFVPRLAVSVAFAGVLFLAAGLNRVPAQQAGKGQERLLYDEKLYSSKKGEINSMFQGEVAADKNTLDLAAQHFAYRLTLTDMQSKQSKMPNLVQEAIKELNVIRGEDRKPSEAAKIFHAALLARLREVLPNPRPIASVNAALLLAYMAGQGQEEVVDALAEALNDKDMNGGTKFWAARGLHNFYNLALASEEDQKVRFKDKEREARSIKALLAAMNARLPESPPPNVEEIEGIRYLRRELIRALGASRYPAVTDASGASQGKTAYALARVLRNDGYDPTPRLDELVEAAIGLARLNVSPDPNYKAANEYQLDVAAYHFGRFVLDLARLHQGRKAAEADAPATRQAWKTFGARLGAALGSLSAEANILRRNDPNKYRPTIEFVNQIVKLSSPILKSIEADGTASAGDLGDFLEKWTLDKEPIYKGDSASVIKPGATLTTGEPKEKAPAEEKK